MSETDGEESDEEDAPDDVEEEEEEVPTKRPQIDSDNRRRKKQRKYPVCEDTQCICGFKNNYLYVSINVGMINELKSLKITTMYEVQMGHFVLSKGHRSQV